MAPRHSARSATMVAQLALHTRPELDSATTGGYMRDAIERGGYRAALVYYGSDEAKASHTERDVRRVQGRGAAMAATRPRHPIRSAAGSGPRAGCSAGSDSASR